MVVKPAIERAASVRTGPGRDRVHPDVLEAEVPREVANRGVERRLGDAHHVVVRNRALATEVGHGHDRAATAPFHQGLCRPRAGDERVGADVESHPEAVARRVHEAPFQVLGGREGDRVDEDVEAAAEGLRYLGEDALDVVVRPDVALGDERARHGLGEVADALLDPLALVREGDLCALGGEAVGDRPGNRALVGDAQDERLLPLEPASLRSRRPCREPSR